MKSQINNIRPRRGTKRALAVNLEFVELLKKLLKEYGAVESPDNGDSWFFRYELVTKWGRLRFGVFASDMQPDDVDNWIMTLAQFIDLPRDEKGFSLGGIPELGVSGNGKWNPNTYLDDVQVAYFINSVRRGLKLGKILTEADSEQARAWQANEEAYYKRFAQAITQHVPQEHV